MLTAATAITTAVLFTRQDAAYALVIVWAVVGIAVRHAGSPVVAWTAWAAAGIVLLLTAVSLWLSRLRQPYRHSTAWWAASGCLRPVTLQPFAGLRVLSCVPAKLSPPPT